MVYNLPTCGRIISEVKHAVSDKNGYESGFPSPEDRLERAMPGDLVRVVDAPPGVIYVSPRGEWDLWVDELRARHGGSTAVILEPPRSTYGHISSSRRARLRSTSSSTRDVSYDPKRAVRVLMDDGWVGDVWLGALRKIYRSGVA